jgi:predicted anti-sigma-YlaC factor YlaD
LYQLNVVVVQAALQPSAAYGHFPLLGTVKGFSENSNIASINKEKILEVLAHRVI